MRKKSLALLGATVAFFLSAEASRITPEQASAAARSWVRAGRALGQRMNADVDSVREVEVADGVTLHVVRMKGGGYVVMGADTTADPVVAYSATGDLRADPSNPLWALLKGDFAARARAMRLRGRQSVSAVRGGKEALSPEERWAKLLPAADEGTSSASPHAQKLLSAALFPGRPPVDDVRVDALVKSAWAQRDYRNWGETNETDYCYNYYTPGHSPCGCVATVGAQLMRFHEYPTQEVAAAEYPCKHNGVDVSLPMFGGVYAWSDMPLVPADFADGCPEAQRQAIGKLTSDVGVSCRTEYNDHESFCQVSLLSKRLVDRFGYANAEIVIFNGGDVYDYGYSLERLKAAVIPSLDAGLPVILGIKGEVGGHVGLGDGYGYSGGEFYLHLNLGWAGVDGSDAWYKPPEIDDFDTIEAVLYNIWPEGPAGGSLVSGRVLDLQGNVVVGAHVTATDGSQRKVSTKTDAKGLYALAVAPGECLVEVDNGLAKAQTNVVVNPCVSTDVTTDGLYTSATAPAIGNLFGIDLVVNASLWQTEDNADGTVTVVGVSETVAGAVEVPGQVNGKVVSGLADGAFAGREDITRISLPPTLTQIGSRAFAGCANLRALAASEANPAYRSTDDGLLYDRQMQTLVCCPAGHVGPVSLPEGLLEIGDDAFCGCRAVAELTVPSGVKRIGARAFVGSGIRSMALPPALETVGAEAFAGLGTVLETVWLEAGETARIRPLLVRAGLEGSATAFIEIYNVSFDLGGRGSRTGGGEMFQRVQQGRPAELPLVVAPTGWAFLGWFTAAEGGVSAEGLPVESNLTYRAHWRANEYKLVYAPGGADGQPLEVVLTYDTEYRLADSPFVKTGSYFAGWTDGNGMLHRPGEVVLNLASEEGATVTYTATWYESPFDYAVGGPGLKWETCDDYPWTVSSDRPRSGQECLRSNQNVTNTWGASSWLKTTVRGPADFRFRYRRTQYTYPFVVKLDGEEVVRNASYVEGQSEYESDWELVELSIPGGEHEIVFDFTYQDGFYPDSFNGVWLDDVELGQYTRQPTFSPESTDVEASARLFTNSLAVAISAELGATIYYTTDGTEPTVKSSVYREPLVLTATTLVKAMAIAPNKDPGPVASALYIEDGPVEPGVWTTNADAVRRSAATHGNLIAVAMTTQAEGPSADLSGKLMKLAEDAAFTDWAGKRGVYLVLAVYPDKTKAYDWFMDWFNSEKGPADKSEGFVIPSVAFFNAWEPDVPVGCGEFWKGATVNGIKYVSTVESLKACFESFLTERPLPDRVCAVTLSGRGWHEVSFNVLPPNAMPETVFAGVRDVVEEVQGDGKSWRPDMGGTLERLEIGKGYWVKTLAETVTVLTSGPANPDVVVKLQQGWNLVGYPLLAEGAVETVLRSPDVRHVYSEGRVYPAGRLATMKPGKGYWIWAEKTGDLTFDNQGGLPPALSETGGASAALPSGQVFDQVMPTLFTNVRLTFGGDEARPGAGVAVYRRSDGGLCGYGEVLEGGALSFGLQVAAGEAVCFKGWRQSGAAVEELVAVVGGSIYKDADYAMPTPGAILEGVWLMDRASSEEDSPIFVSFDSNGGEPLTPQRAGLHVGRPLQLGMAGFPTPPTRAGYSFAGWYTAKSGGELMGDEKEICLTDPSVTTLYAHWGEPRILFDLADGSPRECPAGAATIEPLQVRVDGLQQPKISVSGLPKGMKFASKPTNAGGTEVPVNCVYGVPSKDGVYAMTVKATSSERKDANVTATFVVTVRKAGAAVTVVACDAAQVTSGMRIASVGGEFALAGDETDAALDLVQGVNYAWPLDVSLPFGLQVAAVKVSGLPGGLKFTAKPLVDKKSGTTVPANTIYGVPGAASKADGSSGALVPSTVKVTVTAEGKVSRDFTLAMTVRPLPAWAAGTFVGRATAEDGSAGEATMTVAASGKISGTFSTAEGGKTLKWKYSKTGFDDANFTFAARAKAGKEERSVTVTVAEPDDGACLSASRASGSFGSAQKGGALTMWRNVWKDKDSEAISLVRPLAGSYNVRLDGGPVGCGYLTAKVDEKGGVKLAGKLPDGTGVSSSSSLAYDGTRGFFVPWFFAPSAYKGGFVSGDLCFGTKRTDGVDGADIVWVNLSPTAAGGYGTPFSAVLSASGTAYDKSVALRTRWRTPLAVKADMPGLSVSYKDGGRTIVPDLVPAANAKFTCWLKADEKNKFVAVSPADGSAIARAGKPEPDGAGWNYDVENVEALAVAFKPDSGVFTGTFVCWHDYFKSPADEAGGKLTHASQKISFEGVWVQDPADGSGRLCGFGLVDRIGLQPGAGKTYKYKASFPVEIRAVGE